MAGTRSGFNRKTRQQVEVTGGYRPSRHGELQNPEPSPGRPEMSPDLSAVGQAEWARIMADLEDMQAIWKADRQALYQYCRLFEETEDIARQQAEAKATLQILQDNVSDVEKADLVQLFQQIVMQQKLISKCTDQLRSGRTAIRQFLVEFALTPASRGRVKLPSKAPVADDFTAFQQARMSRLK